jgi:hypothetical protein
MNNEPVAGSVTHGDSAAVMPRARSADMDGLMFMQPDWERHAEQSFCIAEHA